MKNRAVRKKYEHFIRIFEPLIKAVSADRLLFSDDKLLASDTDVAFTAPEVSQMPAFIHSYCVFTSEDQLNTNGEKQTVVTGTKINSIFIPLALHYVKAISYTESFFFCSYQCVNPANRPSIFFYALGKTKQIKKDLIVGSLYV